MREVRAVGAAERHRETAANLTGEVLLPLLSEALAREGSMRWRLRGNSMAPTLPADCEIEIVALTDHRPRLGEVLVFSAGDALIAHRLVWRSGMYWITQGDGRRGPDPPLHPSQALGKVAAAYQGERQIWPTWAEPVLAAWWVARYHGLQLLRVGRRAARRLTAA